MFMSNIRISFSEFVSIEDMSITFSVFSMVVQGNSMVISIFWTIYTTPSVLPWSWTVETLPFLDILISKEKQNQVFYIPQTYQHRLYYSFFFKSPLSLKKTNSLKYFFHTFFDIPHICEPNFNKKLTWTKTKMISS